MGYYSHYTIEVLDKDTQVLDPTELPDWEENFRDYTGYKYNWIVAQSQKWYDFDEDMVQISKLYPEVTFEVERVGEDPDDRVLVRFRNGNWESKSCKVVYEDFKTIT